MNLCHFCRARLGEFLEGTLPGAEREKVAAHLETCADCAREKQELEVTIAALHDLKPVAAPPQLRLKVRAALQEEARAKRVNPKGLDFTWLRPAKMAWAGSLTLAAMLLLVLARPYSQRPLVVSKPVTTVPSNETAPAEVQVQTAPPVARKKATSDPKRATATVPAATNPRKRESASVSAPPVVIPGPMAGSDTIISNEPVNPRPERRNSLRPPSTSAGSPPQPSSKKEIPRSPAPKLTQPNSDSAFPGGTSKQNVTPPTRANILAKAENQTLAATANRSVLPQAEPPAVAFGAAPGVSMRREEREAPALRADGVAEDARRAKGAIVASKPNLARSVAPEPKFRVEIAALSELKAAMDRQSTLADTAESAAGVAAASAPAPPESAAAKTGARSPLTEPVLRYRAGANTAQDAASPNRSARLENRSAPPAPAALPAPSAPQMRRDDTGGGANSRSGLSSVAPVGRSYRFSVTPPGDLKNAQIILALPNSLRFEATSPANSRVLWQGVMREGKTVEIDINLFGVNGGEKISLRLEQIEPGWGSKPLETQILTLPAPK